MYFLKEFKCVFVRKNLVLTVICLKVIFLMVVRKKGIVKVLRKMGVRFGNL